MRGGRERKSTILEVGEGKGEKGGKLRRRRRRNEGGREGGARREGEKGRWGK
jgi:hypothetical protein